jgi:hypothetical protein
MIVRNNITEVVYNVQSTVDAKHNIPIDFKVTNKNDSKAMGAMVRRAKTILGNTDFTAIFDKAMHRACRSGYHTGTEFDYAHKHGVEVLVAFPDVASHAPDISFDVEHFNYNKERDEYTCPAGELLSTNGRWYNKASGKTINRVKHYKTKACPTCSLFARCTRNKSGRFIERSEHMDLIDANKKRIQQNMEIYRKRQAIVEHPFGVIKRLSIAIGRDFYYIMTKKSMKHASADVGLIFTCYNLRRIFNLLGQIELKEFLKKLAYNISALISHFKVIQQLFNFQFNTATFSKSRQVVFSNRLYLTKKQFALELERGF